MTDKPFLLVSLDEEKSKKLAQVLSNDTSRKILDYMSKKEYATETEIAKDLKIPLSTAHYNMDLLLKADLINGDQYKYSEKGKKIVHYMLSNKYVIIAPRKVSAIFEKLKEFLPVVIISGLATVGVKYFFMPKPELSAAPMMQVAEGTSGDLAVNAAGASLKMAVETAPVASEPNIALWFLIGCMFSIVLYLLISMFKKKK